MKLPRGSSEYGGNSIHICIRLQAGLLVAAHAVPLHTGQGSIQNAWLMSGGVIGTSPALTSVQVYAPGAAVESSSLKLYGVK